MENTLFTKGRVITTDGGQQLAVYELTEEFAFLAPVEYTDEEIVIKVSETIVYPASTQEEVISALSALRLLRKAEAETGEVVDAEIVDAQKVNEAVENWKNDTAE